LFGKYDCTECGKRHRKGECEMTGGSPSRRANKPVKKPEPEKPACFPHKWVYDNWTWPNRKFHKRMMHCSKCRVTRPGYQEISKHHIRLGVCGECGGTFWG
jgi:hypothetical protein